MPKAARLMDATGHGTPLQSGPGSPDVNIGYQKAWRASPASVGPGVESASGAMKSLMDSPLLTPADATPLLAEVAKSLSQAAGAAGGAGNGGAGGGVSSAMAGLTTANVALTSAYTTAAAAPGGEPAASQAYTKGIQAAASAAASAAVAAIAAGIADLHTCPTPCASGTHGAGVVTRGSSSVFINKLPASRQGDQVFEAAGGADPITAGCPSVNIGG